MNVELKERVIAKASLLFVRNGIKSVTMDYIAAQMGISKRTLYENFKDKDELLLETIRYMNRQAEKETLAIAEKSVNSMDLLLRVYQHIGKKLRNTNRNYFTDVKRYHPKIAVLFEEERTERIKNAHILMKQGMAEGLIRPDLKIEIVSMLMIAQLDSLKNTDDLDISRFSFIDIFETMFMNFIRGIATPKGVAFIEEFIAKKMKD